jgi:hypothetical protein
MGERVKVGTTRLETSPMTLKSTVSKYWPYAAIAVSLLGLAYVALKK